MPFYTPGPYEEYVGKLSSIRVVPKPEVWSNIHKHLDTLELKKQKVFLWKVSAAVVVLFLVFGFSISLLTSNHNEFTQLAFSESEAVFDTHMPQHTVNLPPRAEILPLPVHVKNKTATESINRTSVSTTQPQQVTSFKDIQPRPTSALTNYYSKEQISLALPNKNDNMGIAVQKPESKNKRWSVRAYLNPLFSTHTMAAMSQAINPNENGVWLWGGELQVKRSFNKILSFVTGVTVNPTGQNIDNLILLQSGIVSRDIAYLVANTSYGQVTLESSRVGISNYTDLSKTPKDVLKSSSLTTARLKQRFHHIEIPLLLSARLSTGNVDVDFRFGGAVGVLVNNQFEVFSSTGQFVGQTEGVRRFNAAAVGAISIGIPLTKQVSFVVEPYARVGLFTLDYESPSSYPFNASVRFGLGYRF